MLALAKVLEKELYSHMLHTCHAHTAGHIVAHLFLRRSISESESLLLLSSDKEASS